MKRLLSAILSVIAAMLLSGCIFTQSPSEFAAENQSLGVAGNEQAVTNACLQWVKDKETLELSKYDSLEKSEKAFALMHRETMSMVKDVWGKGNECKPGTNQWDAYIAYVKEVEQSHRQYSSDAKSVATFGIVTAGAVKLADSLMGAAGDRINNSGAGAQISTNKEDNDTVAVANEKSKAEASTGGNDSEKQGECTIEELHLSDCRTTPTGAATHDEYNACLTRDYGYTSEQIAGCKQ